MTTASLRQPSHSLIESAASVFRVIGNALVAAANNHTRMARVQRLYAMSDGELAERGIKREDIVRHVFSDLFYT